MKKLINFLIMMVMAVAVVFSLNAKKVNASSVTNKGSTVVMMNITMPTTGSDLTAETTDWVVQQNSSSNLMPLQAGTAVMNNTNKLMGIDDASPLSSKMMIASNLLIGPNSRIMETGVGVSKIPNFYIISFCSSNTQMSKYDRTQWRQNSIDTMACCEMSEMCKGTNGCNVKKVDSFNYSLYSGSKNSADLST